MVKKVRSIPLFCIIFLAFFIASCTSESQMIVNGDDAIGSKKREESTCGNGKIEDEEACDDGNGDNNDGCSGACQIESGWECDSPVINDANRNIFVSQIVVRRVGNCVPPLLSAPSPSVESTLMPLDEDSSVKIPKEIINYKFPSSNFEKCFVDPPAGSSDSRTTFKTEFTYEFDQAGNKVFSYSKVGSDLNQSFFPFLDLTGAVPFTAVFTIKYMEEDEDMFKKNWPLYFNFASDDDLYVYVDEHRVATNPGAHDITGVMVSKESMIQLPDGGHSQKGKVHTLQVFYMNRIDIGRIKLQIPTTVVSTCYRTNY